MRSPFVQADEVAAEVIHDEVGGGGVVRIHHHAVGHPGREILHMAGPHPHRNIHRLGDLFAEYLGQALAGGYFDALHAKDKGLSLHIKLLDLRRQLPQLLGADGNDHHRPKGQRGGQIIPQKKRIRQGLIFVSALGPQLGKPAGTGAAPQQDLVLCAMIGGQKSAPTAAAQDGKFHGAFSLLF